MARNNNSTGKRGMSIRIKLTATILALSIIPLLVITLLLTNNIKSTVLELENTVSMQKIATVQKETQDLIDITFVGVDLLARNHVLAEALQSPTEENIAAANQELLHAQGGFKESGLLFLYGKDAMQIARGDDKELNSLSDREYAQASIRGERFLSDVMISKSSGQANVYMADPVLTPSGNIVGGVARSASLATLSEALVEIVDSNTEITVIDKVGSLAATTEDQYDLTSGEIIDLSGEEYFQLANSTGSGTKVTTHNNKKVLMAYALDANTGWTIVVFTDYDYVIAPYTKGLYTALTILLIAIIIITLCGLLFSNSIAAPIIKVKEFAQTLASGDFTTEPLQIHRRDELGQMSDSLNDMYRSNADVIRNIGEGSHQVSESSNELASTSSTLLSRFEEVSTSMQKVNDAMTSTGAATEEVSASTNEVNQSVEKLAEETKNTKNEVIHITKKAAQIEKEGRESSEHAIAIATERGRELEEATEAAKVVSEIGTMADSIADIANQINLLSLNASIEAARAGEHGRGFAVVADEINNLATETKSAVEQIQETVAKIQSAFNQLSASSESLLAFMRDTVAPDYEKFITIGQEYGSDAQKFGALADNISDMVAYISESMEQVNAAIAEIAESATSTATSSAEVTETVNMAGDMMGRVNDMAGDSQDVSQHLDEIVRRFKLS